MLHARAPMRPTLLLFLLLFASAPARAQVCTDAGAYCEGWSRDSTRREVSLTSEAECFVGVPCPATCSTAPIVALPSVRVGGLNHVVLGFAISDACVPECPGALQPEPCYNLGISYRRRVDSGSESTTGVFSCDPSDPATKVAAGATFSGTYATGGTESVTISNIVYGASGGPDDCGAPPMALDLVASGPNLSIQSHFTFEWLGNTITAYHETRTYTALPGPNNVVTIHCTNIDFGAGTYTVGAPNAVTPALRSTWGRLKRTYR